MMIKLLIETETSHLLTNRINISQMIDDSAFSKVNCNFSIDRWLFKNSVNVKLINLLIYFSDDKRVKNFRPTKFNLSTELGLPVKFHSTHFIAGFLGLSSPLAVFWSIFSADDCIWNGTRRTQSCWWKIFSSLQVSMRLPESWHLAMWKPFKTALRARKLWDSAQRTSFVLLSFKNVSPT